MVSPGPASGGASNLLAGMLFVVSGSAGHFLNLWLGAGKLDDVDIHRFLDNHQQVVTLA